MPSDIFNGKCGSSDVPGTSQMQEPSEELPLVWRQQQKHLDVGVVTAAEETGHRARR